MFEDPKKLTQKDAATTPDVARPSRRPAEPLPGTHRPRLFVEQKAKDIALQLGHNDPDRVQEYLDNADR